MMSMVTAYLSAVTDHDAHTGDYVEAASALKAQIDTLEAMYDDRVDAAMDGVDAMFVNLAAILELCEVRYEGHAEVAHEEHAEDAITDDVDAVCEDSREVNADPIDDLGYVNDSAEQDRHRPDAVSEIVSA